jgi:hypothetical protein
LDEFKQSFDVYRGRLKGFSKQLNYLHFNILANFSEIANDKDKKNNEDIMKTIMVDLKGIYRKNESNKRKYEEFVKRKFYEVEIIEIITRIGTNLTKYPKLAYSLMDCKYYHDILQILINIKKDGDYITETADRLKKKKDEVKKIVLLIVENSLNLIYNCVSSETNDISELFGNVVKYFFFNNLY